MTTVVNNPGGSGESSAVGMIIGVLLAILLVVLFFVYALPAIRGQDNNDAGININLDLPEGDYNGENSGSAQ